MCYYARVREICENKNTMDDYYDLFKGGFKTGDDLRTDFADAFGSSYASGALPPALTELFNGITRSGPQQGFLRSQQTICQSGYSADMTLDMVITARVVLQFCKGFCNGESTEELETEIRTLDWKLPKVRFSYAVEAHRHRRSNQLASNEILSHDPEGIEEVREFMEGLYPRLDAMATSSAGASFQYQTKTGETIQLLPEMHMTREQLTKAFLATRNMDQDNLATRMIQAKHTGRWRYACQALHHYMDNPKHARSGSNGPEYNPHATDRQSEYTSPYDQRTFYSTGPPSLYRQTNRTCLATDESK